MAKYKVVTRCHGFRRRIWEVGQIVEIDPSENPPHHFVKIDSDAIVAITPTVKDQHSLSEMGKPLEVKGGMGSSLPKYEVPTRKARPKK